ncbi:acyltransferase [Salinimicrobium flavum]|uniref:Acyltransferase n=1 Tax=Salinimicrobium flavum TaxID=1737065 RepID=A0ABW5IUZ5_9FLAO
MKGRNSFGKFNFIFKPIYLIISTLPDFFVKFMWSLILPFDGYVFKAFRYCILKAKAKKVGDNVSISANVKIKYWEKFSCGSNVSIHDFCYIDCDGGVTIGDNVSIAHSSSLISANHTWELVKTPIKYNPLIKKGIIIKDDVWVGCGVRILDGVNIEERTVVAAGSILNKNFPGECVVGGVPAKILKTI